MDELQNKLEAYERLVATQSETIKVLEMQLRNERYRHSQLMNSPKGNGITSIED